MSIQFGSLNKVNKTYSREGGVVRKQEYTGLKFRRSITEATKKSAQEKGEAPAAEEQFFVSNAIFNELNLAENAFMQYNRPDGSGVMLVVLNDEHPDAKILKSNSRGKKKTKMFLGNILAEDLVKCGTLDASFLGNQFLKLEKATDVTDVPDYVKGVYNVVPDTAVAKQEQGDGEDEDVKEAKAEVADAGNDF